MLCKSSGEYSETDIYIDYYEMNSVIPKGREVGQKHGKQCKWPVFRIE